MINVITADFSSWNTFTTEKCYMYDKGQILQITGLNLPEYFEVHFSNVENGVAKKAIGHNNFVNIYDEYFETGKPIYCYIVLSQGNSDKKTVYKVTIPIIKRSRPVDEQPTPEQQSLIEEALAALYTAQAKADHYAALLENARAQATTLDYRAFATAEYENGVFTFGIPRGTPGIQGEPGVKGDTGPQGQRGQLILHIETAPTSGSYNPQQGADNATYRILNSTVQQEGGALAIIGDTLQYSSYYYPVVGLDSTYVYMSQPYPVFSVPAGGTTGQFLVKRSNTDFDMEWITVPQANGNSF